MINGLNDPRRCGCAGAGDIRPLSALAGLVTSMSDEDGSVTRWIDALKEGQPEAAEALWRRYYRAGRRGGSPPPSGLRPIKLSKMPRTSP